MHVILDEEEAQSLLALITAQVIDQVVPSFDWVMAPVICSRIASCSLARADIDCSR